MFSDACDAEFADVSRTNLALVSVIYGTVHNAFERGLSQQKAAELRQDLIARCRAYLANFTV